MDQLNLPTFEANVKQTGSYHEIFDSFRKKYVRLSPEEWVRQHFAHYLVNKKAFPKGLIALEYPLQLNTRRKRADIVVFDSNGSPLVVVECKASSVKITQKVFDQIARYNMAFKVNYLIVTNGLEHYFCKIDYTLLSYKFLEEMPNYNDVKHM